MANIKADSSLVAAAYRASMAGVPKDMTKLMQNVVATHGQMVSSMAQGASIAIQGLTKSVTETNINKRSYVETPTRKNSNKNCSI